MVLATEHRRTKWVPRTLSKGFKHWYGVSDDATIARLMQELTDKGMSKFVADLAVELQVSH